MTTPKPLRVTLYKDSAKKWRFRVRYSNGRTLASSEAFSDRTKCRKSAHALVNGMFCLLAIIEEPGP